MKTIITENLKNTQRYIPHTLDTRLAAVKTYRNNNSINFICRRYKISKASLMRWNKKYDGTKESLMDKSHKPYSQHPNSHTSEELSWIKNLIKRNPNISMIELYAKLKFNKGYKRHPCSLFRILRKLAFYKNIEKKAKPYIPKPYNTPKTLGEKWQLDVKYVPKRCYTGVNPDKFYGIMTMIKDSSFWKGSYVSFPSGHTITIWGTIWILSFIIKSKAIKIPLFILGILVGMSRIYLVRHWTTDVVASVILSYFIAKIIYKKINMQWYKINHLKNIINSDLLEHLFLLKILLKEIRLQEHLVLNFIVM